MDKQICDNHDNCKWLESDFEPYNEKKYGWCHNRKTPCENGPVCGKSKRQLLFFRFAHGCLPPNWRNFPCEMTYY